MVYNIYINKESDYYKKIYLLRLLSFFHIKINNNYKGIKTIQEIDNITDILNTRNRKDKYSKIYNLSCDYLDNEFICKDLCNFKNNICICNRNKAKEKSVGSCCVKTKTKEVCSYFDDNNKYCKIRSLGCKLFVCPYLKKKGINYRVNDVVYLKYLLSFRQKIIAKCSIFTPEELVVNKWLKFYKLY